MRYGIRKGKAGMDTANPGTLSASVKKADSVMINMPARLKSTYSKEELLLNHPAFFKAMARARVAKYVNATSTTEIRPKSSLTG